jgi:GNAT superfamily N-acetyltransferase
MPIAIGALGDASPHSRHHIVTMLYDEWARDYRTFTPWQTPGALQDHLETTRSALVALYGDAAVGIITMDTDGGDIGAAPELDGPWVANLLVLPRHRRCGLGATLLQAALAHLATAAHVNLCCTNDALAEYYARVAGFRRVKEVRNHGHLPRVIVMCRDN